LYEAVIREKSKDVKYWKAVLICAKLAHQLFLNTNPSRKRCWINEFGQKPTYEFETGKSCLISVSIFSKNCAYYAD
jgi:hypothetical protein